MTKEFISTPVNIDPRKRRTQAKLLQALTQLQEDDAVFDQLEVKAVCAQAGVSRATFYRNHIDLRDIIIVQFILMMETFERQIDALAQVNYATASAVVIDLMQANRDVIRLVEWSGTQQRVTAIIGGTVQRILILRDYTNTPNQPAALSATTWARHS